MWLNLTILGTGKKRFFNSDHIAQVGVMPLTDVTKEQMRNRGCADAAIPREATTLIFEHMPPIQVKEDMDMIGPALFPKYYGK